MTKEQFIKVYDEIYKLKDEFNQKWRKNDFRFIKEKDANEKRVKEIINKVVQIIQDNKDLKDIIFEDQDDAHKTYMELRGFRVESEFVSYVNLLLRKMEERGIA